MSLCRMARQRAEISVSSGFLPPFQNSDFGGTFNHPTIPRVVFFSFSPSPVVPGHCLQASSRATHPLGELVLKAQPWVRGDTGCTPRLVVLHGRPRSHHLLRSLPAWYFQCDLAPGFVQHPVSGIFVLFKEADKTPTLLWRTIKCCLISLSN